MSRSARRRKDTAWCRTCDAALAIEDGRGRCANCMDRAARVAARRAVREVFEQVREEAGLPPRYR
jgi:Zn finger protein HypA/HybF involved in hydrogenase expression